MRQSWKAGACAALLAGAAFLSLGAEEPPHFATGAKPVDPALYARLPKVRRHRAWLPRSVDLSDRFPMPGRQGLESDCVEWATVYAARSFLMSADIGHRPIQSEELASPAYVYNRLRPAGSSCSVSTQMVDALNLLKNEGVVSVADFPDEPGKCASPAPEGLRIKAASLKISEWRAVDRETPQDWRTPLILDDVKGSLARGVPVVFAMPITKDYERWHGDGVFHQAERIGDNWHAMALVGYDEDRQAFRLINSWGPNWGDHGYAWIDYATFQALAGEAYALEPASKQAPMVAPPSPALPPLDQLRVLAASMPCASAAVREENGHAVIDGFGGLQDSLDETMAAASKIDARAEWRVAFHPWPQCEAELTLSGALRASPVKLWVDRPDGGPMSGDPVALRGGDRFGVTAETSAARPYLDIIYLQADGSAVELYRGQPGGDGKSPRRTDIGVGGPRQVRFEVAPPYGDEILIAIAADRPLFGPDLAIHGTERQFLTTLRARLVAQPGAGVSAAVLRLRTSA